MDRGEDAGRIDAIVDLTLRLAAGDFTARGELSGSGDQLDAIMAGVNMLGEEIESVHHQLQERLAALEAANTAKSEFVSIVSHEFRTPLTGIQGFSEMIATEDLPVEMMREYAADILTESRRLARLIGDMLDLSRLESGRVELKPETIDLNAILSDVARTAARSSPNHEIVLRLDSTLPTLRADPDKIVQVATNVISNAIKYSPDGGPVEVTSGTENGMARITVRDEGLGIPADMLEKVFEPFKRVDTKASRRIVGTGLGLPIVRQLVELHGGRAWFAPGIDRGSQFVFTLPLTDTTGR